MSEQGGLENKQGGLPFYRQATLFVQMLRAGLGCRGGLKPGKGEFGFSAWDTFLFYISIGEFQKMLEKLGGKDEML